MFWLAVIVAAAVGAGWPTGSHDTRRSGQSEAQGPAEIQVTHDFTLDESLMLNAPPAIHPDGRMFWGTWGVVRSLENSSDPRTWDKLDGSLWGLDEDLAEVWDGPATFDVTPYCYDYDGREDLTWCPNGGEVSFHNGIIDATPTLTGDGFAWVARGDGALYLVDLGDGSSERLLSTWNPEDLEDPEGGGALLGSPLLLPDGGVMVASVGAGPFETSAVYVVDSASGVRWRLPREEGGFSGPFWAPPALSPEGDRAYLATWAGPGFNDPDEDRTRDGLVLALNLDAADDAEDEDRILWQGVPVSGDGDPLYVRTLSVGVDGALYLGGMARERMDAWVVAYAEDGTWLWGTLLDREDTELVRGLALDEDGDGTLRILATTGHRASSERGGRLHALSPATGEVIWTFDPEDEGGRGAPSGLAVDVAGSTYFATQGAEGRGRVFSVAPDGDLNWKFCHENYEGAHPVITPEGDVVVGEGEPLLCALTAPLSNTCRARATDRKVRVFYADADAAPDKASRAFQCCRCSAGAGGSGGALWMVLLLLVHRRRLR